MIEAGVRPIETSTPLRTLALSLIGVAHLPFFGVECQALWARDHYQFFPFAFAAFGWLLHTRRLAGAFRWDSLNTGLVVADLACLVGSIAMPNPSPLLVYVGLLLFLFAVCRAYSDRNYSCSLSYLLLLPLMTLRPPWNYDVDAIQWLQKSTTGVASELLNYFGFLHLRLGNVLEFPGKRFLVEEACSGVQSLFTLLFLAALIVCGHRRRWFHTLGVLVSAVCLAAVMNVLRICSVAVAWSEYSVDVSSGWQHDLLGYVALIVAGLLVLSSDALLDFVASPVPDEPGAGVQSIYRNPFVAIWNWTFYLLPRTEMNDVHVADARPGKSVVAAVAAISMCLVTLQLLQF